MKNKYTKNFETKYFKMTNLSITKGILLFFLTVLFSPNEPVHFLCFFTSWFRIQEAFLYADPCGSETLILIGPSIREN